VATEQLGGGYWLQVGKTTEAQAALLERFRVVAAWVLILGLALGLLAGALLASRALGPIRRLIAAVHRVLATGHMDARVPVRAGPGDELHELTCLFNAMLEKNGALLRGMREALDNVAHDLRTPLTRLRSTAERTLAAPPGPADREAVSDALEETERVLLLLDTLMDISEAETGLMRLEKAEVPLRAAAAEATALYEMVAEDRGIAVQNEVPADAQIFADPQRLRQALVNLLDNALKYTPRGGTVTIFAESRPSSSVLGVRDTGPGIALDEMPRIWERLYRGDKSRSARGLGLGLALVKAIAQAHGGAAEVESPPGSGAVFRLILPASPRPA
jgi:signal transduction histidine kinase